MYTFHELMHDLKEDLARYEDEHEGARRRNFISKILVLRKSPAFFAILNYRYGKWMEEYLRGKQSRTLKILLKSVYHVSRFLFITMTKIEINQSSDIRGGLHISNKGNCIIGVREMGRNCTIGHTITIGLGKEDMAPIIGENVTIGSGSVLYGSITIGDNTVIDECTVLTKSVPASSRVSGNPGKIVKSSV